MTQFKKFKIKNFFKIHTGRDVIIGETKKGNIPLVSHQHDNNGIAKFIEPLENRILFNYKDTIALADRGVFYATTQNQDFYIGTRVKALTFLDGEKSEKIRLYFVAAINKLQIFFKEYLDNATDQLPELDIMLPVDSNGDVDYDYMEKSIDKTMNNTFNKLEKNIKTSKLPQNKITKKEKQAIEDFKNNKIKYRQFKISELFIADNGDTDIQQEDINGMGEYVISSGESNIGVIGKSDIKAKILYPNTITIDMFGNAYFRDYYYKMVTHARVFSIKFKNKDLTVEEGLYLVSQLRYLRKIYSYNNMSSWNKVKKLCINLPINISDEIDYEFMNLFISAIEKKSLQLVSKANKS